MQNQTNKMWFMHSMLRVINLDRSIEFYTNILGMKVFKKKDYPKGQFTLAFLGFPGSHPNAQILLTYNWERSKNYDKGNAFGHLAFGVDNIFAKCQEIRERGWAITREPGPMSASVNSATIIAFIEDPDGYKIELIQRNEPASSPESFHKVLDKN